MYPPHGHQMIYDYRVVILLWTGESSHVSLLCGLPEGISGLDSLSKTGFHGLRESATIYFRRTVATSNAGVSDLIKLIRAHGSVTLE